MHALFRLSLGAAILLAAGRPGAAAEDTARRTVLTIHTDAVHFPANPLIDAGIRDALASREDVASDYFAEYLELGESDGDAALPAAFTDYIRRKYRDRRIDVVIAPTGRALRYVLAKRDELFPNTPIVFASPAVPDGAIGGAGGGITGITLAAAYHETLNVALRLHPSTEQVFVVVKSSPALVEAARAELTGSVEGVRLTFVTEPTVQRLLTVVAAVPPRSLILYIWHAQNEPGNLLFSDAIAALVARAAPVPVYGTSDTYLGSGIVGGVMRSTSGTGTRLGELAVAILSGTPAHDIPIEQVRVAPVFDWRQLRRWGIDPRQLPPGADLRFRIPTLWESYGDYIVATLLVMAVQLTLIVGLLRERSSRQRAEGTLRARERTLRHSFKKIRHLSARLMTAEEAVRADIARELHDGTCQDLVGISMAIEALKRTAGHIQEPAAQQVLNEVRDNSIAVIEGMRRLSHDLHPATLRLVSLPTALRAHCVEAERRHDVQVAFMTRGDFGAVGPDVALCLFRIAQESLRNAAVHGGARRITVSMIARDAYVELAVSDDGTGFDLDAASYGSGLGLISMEERARAVGGELAIETQPGCGTTVRARVPAALPHQHGGRRESSQFANCR